MKTHTLLYLLLATLSLRAELAGKNVESDAPLHSLSLRDVTRAVSERNPAIKEALRRWDPARKRVPGGWDPGNQRVMQEGAWDDRKVAGRAKARRYVDVPPNAFTDQ